LPNLDTIQQIADTIVELTFKSQSDYHIWKCVTTLTVPNSIPQNAISLKNP